MTAETPPMSDPRPYHHGDLRAALLTSARQILEEDGIAALKLRAITRRAEVSAMAAAPHFGNLAGLLSALAAEGFEELARAMSEPNAPRALDVGLAYVTFARAHPGMFGLMFRNELLDPDLPVLAAARERAFGCLARIGGESADGPAHMARLWGLVHGLAVLSADGWLGPLARRNGRDVASLVAAALADKG